MKNLIKKTSIVIIAALSFNSPCEAQVQPMFKRVLFTGNSSKLKLANTKFNGLVIAPKKNTAPIANNRKTVRDGVTREVLPYDGSNNGATEREGTAAESKNGNAICNTQNVTLTAGYSEMNLLDPNGVEIWPGRIINISSIDEGSYNDFTNYTKRNDLKIALVAAGVSQRSIVATIPALGGISQGKVIDARDNIKRQFGSNDFGSNAWMYESYDFYYTNQLLIQAGAGVNVVPANFELRASAGFNSSVKKNKVILKFVRQAFDVKVDNDLNQLIEANNLSIDAGVISNVSYGSLGIIEIESDSAITDINAALDFAFNVDPSVAISGNLRTQLNSTLASMSVKGIFKGVSGNSPIINFPSINDLKNMLLGTGPLSATTPVVPLSFIVKSLKDGSTMMLKSTMSYNKRECTVLPPRGITTLKIKLLALTVPRVNDGFSSTEDIYGKIAMKFNVPGYDNYSNRWNHDVSNYVSVAQSQLPTDEGAYTLTGDARDYTFKINNDAALVGRTKLILRVNLKDEESILGNVQYGVRVFEIPVADLIKSVSASPTESIDNFSNAAKAFFVDVVEQNNTNKVRVWFKVTKN